jgi:hypothetical protein
VTRRNAITVTCSLSEKASLEALAAKHKCLWGKSPNVSALLKAIANEEILLVDATEEQKIRAEIARLQAKL